MSRKYYPVWTELKSKLKCVISAHPLLFKRIVKGVIKEKDRDLAMKVANDLDSLYLIIIRDEKKNTITFKLKQRIGISDLVVV